MGRTPAADWITNADKLLEIILDFIDIIIPGERFLVPDKPGHPFTKPALILTGRQDHVTGYQDAWSIIENYPRDTYATLDRAGHNLQIEQAELFSGTRMVAKSY